MGDEYSVPVAVSADGTTTLVGADDVWVGNAYIYRVATAGSWATTSAPTATLANGGAYPTDGLGAVALTADGTTAVVGAPGVHQGTGAADVFHVSSASSWATTSTPNAIVTVKALAACVVPKLKGLKLSGAKQALVAGRCSLGKVSKVQAPSKKYRHRVLHQTKKPGKRLAIGAKIDVRVGK